MNFIDLHSDYPLKITGNNTSDAAVDLSNNIFENYVQTLAVFIDDCDLKPRKTYESTMSALKQHLANYKISPFAQTNNKEYLLSLENGSFLAQDPDYIKNLKSDGICMISLSWNKQNPLAGGSHSKSGLTELGKHCIKLMNREGIALDISHLNMTSALQAVKISNKVLASHSNCAGVFNHPRNLTDEVLLEIKRSNGIIGLCFYPEFLGCEPFDGIKRNIDYLVKMGMKKNIAIGSDFDGAKMSENLKSLHDVPTLYDYLRHSGIKSDLLNDIFYSNAIAFFSGMCKNNTQV